MGVVCFSLRISWYCGCGEVSGNSNISMKYFLCVCDNENDVIKVINLQILCKSCETHVSVSRDLRFVYIGTRGTASHLYTAYFWTCHSKKGGNCCGVKLGPGCCVPV